MIGVTDLKAGTIFEEQGNLLQVISYEHIKMGRGSANIKVRVKNVRTGSTIDKSFINGAKVNEVNILKKDLQFLYKDLENAYFMNPQTFDQISISLKIIGEDVNFLTEGENFTFSFLENEALSLNLPSKMDFMVSETPQGVKGNSATNVFKDAVLENGMNIKVPLFVKNGDKIRIDTRTRTYTEKAS